MRSAMRTMLPEKFYEPSTLGAVRILAKTCALLAAGIIFQANMPDVVGAPLGVLMIAMAMSWTYMIGNDCGHDSFFPSKSTNSLVGTLALIPLLRPLSAVSSDVRDKLPQSLWFERMFQKFFGVSVSHFGVYAFLVTFVPIMIWNLGVWGLMKYWLLPFVVMHLNMGTLSATQGSRPSYMLLFPEIRPFVQEQSGVPTKKKGPSPKGINDVPVYNLENAAAWVLNGGNESSSNKKSESATVRIELEADGSGFVDSIWSYSGAKFVTRELLLWRKRDLLLYLSVGLSVVALLHPSFSGFETVWASAFFAALLPFLLVHTGISSRAHEMQRKAAVREIDAKEGSVAADGKTLLISRKQLESHPEWVAIEGSVYDLEEFAPKHPGGNLIRSMGGIEATALFYSMHPHTPEKNLKVLNKYKVGELSDPDLFNFTYHSAFAKELKEAVAKKVGDRSWYAGTGFWLRTFGIALCTLTAEYFWATTGNVMVMMIVGALHAMIGVAVQHDASHGAFSSSPTLNAILSYGADWVGNSRWLWLQQHIIGHHPHTNIEGHDCDAHSAEPMLNFHMFPPAMRKWFHQYQWLYMYLVLPWYGPSVVYNGSQLFSLSHGETPYNPWVADQIPFAVMTRLFYVARIVAVPYYLGVASLPLALIGVPIVTGFFLTFVFVVSHNFEDSERYPLLATDEKADPNAPVDWYKLQTETSCSYGGNIGMFFTGGLNFQIEHHLFPRLSSWYYPEISDTVRAVCEKHGVRYVYYPTLWDNVKSCIKYMAATGAPHDDRLPKAIKETIAETETKKEKNADITSPASQCYYTEDSIRAVESSDAIPVTVDGVTYNVKKWLPYHPGGDIILHYAGRDATEVFHAMHGKEAFKSLARLPKMDPNSPEAQKIFRGQGQSEQKQKDLKLTKAQKAMNEDYAKMMKEFEEEGLTESSKLWYLYKTLSTLGIGVAGLHLYVVNSASGSWTNTLLSAVLLGVSFQQLGWLAHDFCHHACFENRNWNTAMGYFLGNFCQGFSVLWWRTRHNEHHAATNILEHDPDIENLPVMAWSLHDAKNAVENWGPSWLSVLKYQHIYYLPFISLLHIIWAFQSIVYAKNMFGSTNRYYRRMAKVETMTLAGHWFWRLLFLSIFSPSFAHGFMHWFVTELVGGFGIGAVVFCNHYPVEKVDDESFKCFPELQVLTTVDVAHGVVNDWICGGLNYQIEHHLYPTLPRHNYTKVSRRVQEFCKKHKLPYRAPGLIEAVSNTVLWLKEITTHLPKDPYAAASKKKTN